MARLRSARAYRLVYRGTDHSRLWFASGTRYDAHVGNWDLVRPYDTRAMTWLAKEGLPHPRASEGNRAPTLRELKLIDSTGVSWNLEPLGEEGDDAVLEHLRMRGNLQDELRAVYALARLCGQQWLYPDTGAPSIVVDPAIDFDRALDVWTKANERDDGWEWLFRELYSQ